MSYIRHTVYVIKPVQVAQTGYLIDKGLKYAGWEDAGGTVYKGLSTQLGPIGAHANQLAC